MKEIVWQEFNKSDRLVTKRKSFKSGEAMEKFIEKLTEKDNFYTILRRSWKASGRTATSEQPLRGASRTQRPTSRMIGP